ncbi:MAG: galactokinase [Myxococcota bacterium]
MNARAMAVLGRLRRSFEDRFERRPELAARAPGRLNLIGEHTDYNDGLVLPCAIDRETLVVAARRTDGVVRVFSENRAEECSFEVGRVDRPSNSANHWSDYLRGVVFVLAAAGHETRGLDLVLSSNVPVGAGLSSSAALTVSVATIFSLAEGWDLPARERAEIAHRAESEYLGIGSGILDQFASALGERDRALVIDCRSRDVRPIALPVGATRLLVSDSGVRHSHVEANSGYRMRVSECREALEIGGADSLRDWTPDDLPRLESLLEPALFRRVRHVISENERVVDFCAAMESSDLSAAGAIIRAGHRSLRDDYDVSIPELNTLCELADAQPGVYGSRLTGAGFGGCALHLVDPESADEVAGAVTDGFEQRYGRRPPVLSIETADGAGEIDLGG